MRLMTEKHDSAIRNPFLCYFIYYYHSYFYAFLCSQSSFKKINYYKLFKVYFQTQVHFSEMSK